MELVISGLVPQGASVVSIMLEGRLVEVEPIGDGTGTLQRLISSNPQDFMDPRWQPGRRVPLHGVTSAPDSLAPGLFAQRPASPSGQHP